MKHALTLAGAALALATLTPALAADLMQYGRAYVAEGDHAAAVKSYAEVVRLNPFDPVAQNNLAVARAANGDYQSALELLTRAVRLAPERADIRENLTSLQTWIASSSGVKAASAPRAQVLRPVNGAVLPEPPALWGSAGVTGAGSATALPQSSLSMPARR